jgi:hypothetical protein
MGVHDPDHVAHLTRAMSLPVPRSSSEASGGPRIATGAEPFFVGLTAPVGSKADGFAEQQDGTVPGMGSTQP